MLGVGGAECLSSGHMAWPGRVGEACAPLRGLLPFSWAQFDYFHFQGTGNDPQPLLSRHKLTGLGYSKRQLGVLAKPSQRLPHCLGYPTTSPTRVWVSQELGNGHPEYPHLSEQQDNI